MFSTFAVDKLLVINTNDSSNKVSAWKNSSVVAEYYEKLKINGDYYLNKILDKVYGTDLEKIWGAGRIYHSSGTLCFKSKKGAYKNQGRSITKKNSEIFGMFSQIFEMYVIQYNLIMNFVYLGQNEGRFRKWNWRHWRCRSYINLSNFW